jgi:hypothetical protein
MTPPTTRQLPGDSRIRASPTWPWPMPPGEGRFLQRVFGGSIFC